MPLADGLQLGYSASTLPRKNDRDIDRDQLSSPSNVWFLTQGSVTHPVMTPRVRTIIELNIKHYRELLKSELDPVKRRTVEQLLAEEEAKLAKLVREEGRDK